jgi:hypothetical protein
MTDIHSLSLVALKQLARDHVPRIKSYYTMKRIELIQILSMKEFPEEMILAKKTIMELRKEARARGHKNVWRLRRNELMTLLYPRPKQDNENNHHTEKHDNPKSSDGEQVGV